MWAFSLSLLCFLPLIVSCSLDLLNVSEFAERTRGKAVTAIRGQVQPGNLRFSGRCFIHTPEPDTCEAAAGQTDPAGGCRWEHAGRTCLLLCDWKVHRAWLTGARNPVATGRAGEKDKWLESCRWGIMQLH